MFMKNFLSTRICLISVTIQKIQSFLIFFFDRADKKVIGKMKDESEEKIIHEFFGLKSKMYSMKNIIGKQSNTAKGVNTATEFNEFKTTLFNKKIIKHKMRKIQSKKT